MRVRNSCQTNICFALNISRFEYRCVCMYVCVCRERTSSIPDGPAVTCISISISITTSVRRVRDVCAPEDDIAYMRQIVQHITSGGTVWYKRRRTDQRHYRKSHKRVMCMCARHKLVLMYNYKPCVCVSIPVSYGDFDAKLFLLEVSPDDHKYFPFFSPSQPPRPFLFKPEQ